MARQNRLDRWAQRNPFPVLLIGIAVLGWMVWWEGSRIAAAQRTVHAGWGTGLAGGVAASLVMTALLVLAIRASRRTPGRRLGLVVLVAMGITASVLFAFEFTAPPTVNPDHVPYVVTTGTAVAGMAYAATFAAICLALCGWVAVRLVRLGRAGFLSRPKRPGNPG